MQETGVPIDAKATVELLTTIFHPNTPLHDGGVVLRGDRVVAAGCVFPLTQQAGLSMELGMRHRAAIGLSEETDAIVIAVSEETGMISVTHHGRIMRDLDADMLRAFLSRTLVPPGRASDWFVDGARRLISSLITSRAAPVLPNADVPEAEQAEETESQRETRS
jgi:diadenylate cyclase